MSPHAAEHSPYEQILTQHQELKALLVRIDQALAERSATMAQVCELLGLLGDRLVKHFATEENGGYFAEALTHAPQLISTANQLLAQHPKISAEARQITAPGQDHPVGLEDWWNRTAERFRAFRDELLKHETRENVLLQEAYSRDIGSHD